MLLIYLLNLLIHNPLQFIITITIIIVPLFMSIAFHEWAHGYLAYKFGDPTPMLQGRLTLNPFAHLDPVGTLMLFIVGIGWAKPIMLNPLNYPDKTKQNACCIGRSRQQLFACGNFLVYFSFGATFNQRRNFTDNRNITFHHNQSEFNFSNIQQHPDSTARRIQSFSVDAA